MQPAFSAERTGRKCQKARPAVGLFFGHTLKPQANSFTCGPLTSRRPGTNPSEGSRGNSRVAPTTDSLAGAPIATASPSPERGERSSSQEWQRQLASSWFSPSGWNECQLCGVGLFQGNLAIWLGRRYQGSCRLVPRPWPMASGAASLRRPPHLLEDLASVPERAEVAGKIGFGSIEDSASGTPASSR